MKWFIIILIIGVMMVKLTYADIPVSGCGTLSTANTRYYLTQAISGNKCITISANNITFDGVGLNITSTGIGVKISSTNDIVENISVYSATTSYNWNSANATFINDNSFNSVTAFNDVGGDNAIINGSTIVGSGSYGLYFDPYNYPCYVYNINISGLITTDDVYSYYKPLYLVNATYRTEGASIRGPIIRGWWYSANITNNKTGISNNLIISSKLPQLTYSSYSNGLTDLIPLYVYNDTGTFEFYNNYTINSTYGNLISKIYNISNNLYNDNFNFGGQTGYGLNISNSKIPNPYYNNNIYQNKNSNPLLNLYNYIINYLFNY